MDRDLEGAVSQVRARLATMPEPVRDNNGPDLDDEPLVDEDGDFATEHASLTVDKLSALSATRDGREALAHRDRSS